MHGVILYGPPASGKDTVTSALTELDARYRQFPRLKVGRGRSEGYRMTPAQDLAARRASGDIIWENTRYEAQYAVDHSHLASCLADHIPVLHLGQTEAIDAINHRTTPTRWTIVELWCPWPVAEQRIAHRRTGDDQTRHNAWWSTPRLGAPNLAIDTAEVSATDAARLVHSVHSRETSTSGEELHQDGDDA